MRLNAARGLLLLGGLLVATPPVAADDAHAEADRLVDEALQLARINRLTDAILRFRAADKLWPRGNNDCNIGLAYSRLGDHPRALLHIDACAVRLNQVLPGTFGALQQATLRTLQRGAYAQVDLVVDPIGAKVSVPAFAPEDVLSAPRLFWLPLGVHVLRIEAPGFEPMERRIELLTNRLEHVEVKLEPIPPPAPAPVAIPVTPAAKAAVPAITAPPPPPPPAPPTPTLRVAGYTLLGVGVAALGLGLGGNVIAHEAIGQAERASTRVDYDAAQDRHRLGVPLMFTGYVVGATLVISATILLVRDRALRSRRAAR